MSDCDTNTVIIGVGNRMRGDDAAGPMVLDLLRADGAPGTRLTELDGEATRLIDGWSDAELAVVVDACRSEAPAGSVQVIDVTGGESLSHTGKTSTHASGPADAVAIARALGRLPARLLIVTIEGRSFDVGDALTPAVAGSLEVAAQRVRALAR